MNTRLLAQLLTSLMLVYFFLINHLRLSPFNNITRLGTQWRSTVVGLIPGLLVIATLGSSNRLKTTLGAGWLWLWFVLQILTLFSATAVSVVATGHP
jgi:hypothetical protein